MTELVEPQNETILAKVIRHWQGRGRLAWAYWGFHFGGGLLLAFVLAIGFLAILPFAYNDATGIRGSPVFAAWLIVAVGCYLGHAIVSIIMVWRCGENAEWPGWMALSRFQIIAWMMDLIHLLWEMLA